MGFDVKKGSANEARPHSPGRFLENLCDHFLSAAYLGLVPCSRPLLPETLLDMSEHSGRRY